MKPETKAEIRETEELEEVAVQTLARLIARGWDEADLEDLLIAATFESKALTDPD